MKNSLSHSNPAESAFVYIKVRHFWKNFKYRKIENGKYLFFHSSKISEFQKKNSITKLYTNHIVGFSDCFNNEF